MATTIANGLDVVTFLEEQHVEIDSRFEQMLAASGSKRETLFVALKRLLAVHESAEEEVVHPVARRTLDHGEEIVSARLQEEGAARELVSELERVDADSPQFERKAAMLRTVVLLHSRAEEETEFKQLAAVLDEKSLQHMRKAFDFAERVAPVRDDPSAESDAASLLMGAFAAMVAQARDAISGN